MRPEEQEIYSSDSGRVPNISTKQCSCENPRIKGMNAASKNDEVGFIPIASVFDRQPWRVGLRPAVPQYQPGLGANEHCWPC